MKIGQFLAKL